MQGTGNISSNPKSNEDSVQKLKTPIMKLCEALELHKGKDMTCNTLDRTHKCYFAIKNRNEEKESFKSGVFDFDTFCREDYGFKYPFYEFENELQDSCQCFVSKKKWNGKLIIHLSCVCTPQKNPQSYQNEVHINFLKCPRITRRVCRYVEYFPYSKSYIGTCEFLNYNRSFGFENYLRCSRVLSSEDEIQITGNDEGTEETENLTPLDIHEYTRQTRFLDDFEHFKQKILQFASAHLLSSETLMSGLSRQSNSDQSSHAGDQMDFSALLPNMQTVTRVLVSHYYETSIKPQLDLVASYFPSGKYACLYYCISPMFFLFYYWLCKDKNKSSRLKKN